MLQDDSRHSLRTCNRSLNSQLANGAMNHCIYAHFKSVVVLIQGVNWRGNLHKYLCFVLVLFDVGRRVRDSEVRSLEHLSGFGYFEH